MVDFYIQRGFDRLKIIKPNFAFEKWYFTKVLYTPDIENREFYTDSYKSITIDLFNAKKINGTSHCDYNNMMWIEMLGALKRYDSEKYCNMESLLNFIVTSKQSKNLNKYGDYYLIGEGNHRFCLAKFLCIDLHDIAITEHEFNDKYFTKYTELGKRDILIKEKSATFWTLKFNDCIVNINETFIMDFIKMYDDIQIKDSFCKKLYRKKEKIVISSFSDLKTNRIIKLISAHKNTKHYD